MNRMITRVLAFALAVLLAVPLVSGGAAYAAAAAADAPAIRVNGKLLVCPDAQPYIDEHDRTMVPVRFVSDALDAEVDWDNTAKTATVSKDGTVVRITIGSDELTVSKDGSTETVRMDTAAVLKDGRTFLPLRFVAEALGASADYSDVYRTVCISADVLTAEQTAKLTAYPYTQPDGAVGYDEAHRYHDDATIALLYGTDRARLDSFANAREHLYHIGYDESIGADAVDETAAQIGYSSERVTIELLTDESCVYQSDSMDRLFCAVRGIAAVRLNVRPTELSGSEMAMLAKLGFSQLYTDTDMYIDVDVHMNIDEDSAPTIHTIVPLGDAY